MRRKMQIVILGLLGLSIFFLLCDGSAFADEAKAPPQSVSESKMGTTAVAPATRDLEAGEKIYRKRCVFCHGVEGAGDGPSSERLVPKPRDFTMGLFKYRTTESGKLPTDDDLMKVLSDGLPGTGMPAWSDTLKEGERRQVIQFIKTFSKKFARQTSPLEVITVGPEIAPSKESIEKGQVLFREMECFKCHGNEGRGDGPSAPELTDDKGDPIRPRDLTKNWFFRGGGEAKDIYMRFNTGLNGTPMPSFRDSLDNEKSWHLANYVRSLSPEKLPDLNVVIRSKKVASEISTDPSDPIWNEVGPDGQDGMNRFPLVGQVIREPRHFTPTVSDVRLKSVYNEKEIGFLLVWDDPSPSKKNEEAGTFEDQMAIQFPSELYAGSKKPYFLMGDEKKSVNLWTWKAEQNIFVESNANGIDKEREQGKESQLVVGVGTYKDGQYRVVMKRSLATEDVKNDIQFAVGTFVPVAFHAWDGTNGEAKSKRAISHWYYVLMEPETPKSVYIYPPLVVLAVFGLQLLLQKKLRRRNGDIKDKS